MALATIVAVRGSTYRRPGARLLVPEEGAPIGNLSGGCLESDVADMARIVMEEGRARLAGWDLTADDDEVWGLGLGCNGAIEVFIEPADRAAEVTGALRMALDEERPICVVTVLESGSAGVTSGARLVVRPDGTSRGDARRAADRRRGGRSGAGAAREARVRDPDAPGRRPRVRRGARAAAPAADLRRRPRRDPPGEGRLGPGLERGGGRRPPRVPERRAVPWRGRVRQRRAARGRREDRPGRRADVRRGDDAQLPAGQGVRALLPYLPRRVPRACSGPPRGASAC